MNTTESNIQRLPLLLQELGRRLSREFLAKDEIIRLLLLSVVAGALMKNVVPTETVKRVTG